MPLKTDGYRSNSYDPDPELSEFLKLLDIDSEASSRDQTQSSDGDEEAPCPEGSSFVSMMISPDLPPAASFSVNPSFLHEPQGSVASSAHVRHTAAPPSALFTPGEFPTTPGAEKAGDAACDFSLVKEENVDAMQLSGEHACAECKAWRKSIGKRKREDGENQVPVDDEEGDESGEFLIVSTHRRKSPKTDSCCAACAQQPPQPKPAKARSKKSASRSGSGKHASRRIKAEKTGEDEWTKPSDPGVKEEIQALLSSSFASESVVRKVEDIIIAPKQEGQGGEGAVAPPREQPDEQTPKSRLAVGSALPEDGKDFVDVSGFLTMPQAKAARLLGVPPSTLSKRWREAAPARKWPWRAVLRLDKEIAMLLNNFPEGKPLPKEVSAKVSHLMQKKDFELRPVYIRM